MNKKLVVIGGLGYVGSRIISICRNLNINVTSISRRGFPLIPEREGSPVKYIKADIKNKESVTDILLNSDSIINTVGTLIDTSITKNSKPYDDGTYEDINITPSLIIKDILESDNSDKKRNFVFVSANQHLMFVPKYLDTKITAENNYRSIDNLSVRVVKPGIIMDGSRSL